MKQPKSTRNQDKKPNLEFKSDEKVDGRQSPKKRKMTEDQDDVDAGRLTSRKPDIDKDKISISPVSSDDEGKKSNSNTFGFVPMNNLGKSNKNISKNGSTNLVGKVVSAAKADKPK